MPKRKHKRILKFKASHKAKRKVIAKQKILVVSYVYRGRKKAPIYQFIPVSIRQMRFYFRFLGKTKYKGKRHNLFIRENRIKTKDGTTYSFTQASVEKTLYKKYTTFSTERKKYQSRLILSKPITESYVRHYFINIPDSRVFYIHYYDKMAARNPDLLNLLDEIISRFRDRKIAFWRFEGSGYTETKRHSVFTTGGSMRKSAAHAALGLIRKLDNLSAKADYRSAGLYLSQIKLTIIYVKEVIDKKEYKALKEEFK